MPHLETAGKSSTDQPANPYRGVAEAMPDHLHAEAFSLQAGSPERAIYQAVFHSTSMHRKRASDEWELAPPIRSDLNTAWAAMTESFDRATAARVELADIASQLSRRVIGPNDGTIRLLLIAGLLTRREDVVLYENHNLVTSLDSGVAVRISDSISDFSIKNAQTKGGQRKALLDILMRRLQLAPKAGSSRLLEVVISLYRRFQAMPHYAQQTAQSLSRDTLAIRQCFRGASEPDVLIFETLPIILMIQPFASEGRLSSVAAGEYTTGIFKALTELQGVYPKLLENIQTNLADAMHSNATSLPKLRQDLAVKAKTAESRTLDSELSSFVRELRGTGDDQQWLEAIASMATGGASPTEWSDHMVERFHTRIHDLARIFLHEVASQ